MDGVEYVGAGHGHIQEELFRTAESENTGQVGAAAARDQHQYLEELQQQKQTGDHAQSSPEKSGEAGIMKWC